MAQLRARKCTGCVFHEWLGDDVGLAKGTLRFRTPGEEKAYSHNATYTLLSPPG